VKKVIRIFSYFVIAVSLVIIMSIIGFKATHPKVAPPQQIQIDLNAERFARGKYLAETVSSCVDCHSERDWTKLSGPVKPGTEGKGGQLYDEREDVPGQLYARNITPMGLSTWTDGEILRALTEGINKQGEALFPLMPYTNLAQLSRDDLYAIITYVRTLKPIENEIPKKHINFPVSLFVLAAPQPATLRETTPDPSNPVEYGKYMVTAASCIECHTPREKGELVKGMEFAGGNRFVMPNGGTVRSANITPDLETGIGNWSEDTFVQRFKTFQAVNVGERDFNTSMPWSEYANLEEKDLRAMYAYLRSLPAVKNTVVRWTP
jgi:mono/diheme cytochrome c family protein